MRAYQKLQDKVYGMRHEAVIVRRVVAVYAAVSAAGRIEVREEGKVGLRLIVIKTHLSASMGISTCIVKSRITVLCTDIATTGHQEALGAR